MTADTNEDAFARFAPRGLRAARAQPDWSMPTAQSVALVRKSVPSRLSFTFVVALVASAVAPASALLIWCAIVAGWELLARNALENAFVLNAREPGAMRSYAAINFFGALLFNLFPLYIWQTGEPLAMVIATAWICATANSAFVHFATHRLLLIAVLVPLVATALAAPLLSGIFTLTSALASVVLIGLVAIAGVFGHDRRILLSALSSEAASRALADQANATKSRFLARVSQELRTPLDAVIGYAEIIEEDGASAQDARKIQEAARKLLAQINVILDISKLEAGDVALAPQRYDVGIVLREIGAAARPAIEANSNSFDIVVLNELGAANLDALQLSRCLMQLLSNAGKFTKSGAVRMEAQRILDNDGAMLAVRVADTGPGIPEDARARIFEPFLRQDGARREDGAGLGLAYARLLAKLMHGDIECESAPGKGAAFTLTMRLASMRG